MINLLLFLLLIYISASYGYIFGWAIKLLSAGYLKTQQERDGWLFLFIFSPVTAPFIYGLVLAMS